MSLFESEYAKERKEFSAIGFKSQRRNLRYQKKQTGTTDIPRDKVRHALLSGKRVSKAGNIYFESRKNRSDSKGSNI